MEILIKFVFPLDQKSEYLYDVIPKRSLRFGPISTRVYALAKNSTLNSLISSSDDNDNSYELNLFYFTDL